MITSRQNAMFKRIREAMREHDREIVIEGPKMVADAIASGWKPTLIARRSPDGGARLPVAGVESPATGDRRPATIEFAAALFDQISDAKTSQGVLALFERPAPGDVFARNDSIVIALDGVQDPGNVGTIFRLAAAFDAAGVALLPDCADPFGPKAIRASAGAILHVPYANISADDLKGRRLYAADGAGEVIDPPVRDAVLIFGSEGGGVSGALRAKAKRIAIPMSGRVESLNVAAAAAVLLSRSFALRSK